MTRRGVVMLFSDLFDNTDDFIEGLNHLRFRGHNVIFFHVLDPYELEFPLAGMWRFIGLEGEGDLITQPARVRANYLKELESFITSIKTACTRAQVDYVLVKHEGPRGAGVVELLASAQHCRWSEMMMLRRSRPQTSRVVGLGAVFFVAMVDGVCGGGVV